MRGDVVVYSSTSYGDRILDFTRDPRTTDGAIVILSLTCVQTDDEKCDHTTAIHENAFRFAVRTWRGSMVQQQRRPCQRPVAAAPAPPSDTCDPCATRCEGRSAGWLSFGCHSEPLAPPSHPHTTVNAVPSRLMKARRAICTALE